MAKTKENKPDSIKIFDHDDLLTSLPSVPGCKTLSTALNNLFRKKHCKVIVSTWKERIEYKFRFHQFNDYECGYGAIFVSVYPDLDRISIAVVGKHLTDTENSQLWTKVPNAVRTILVRHYKHRKIKTIEAILEAAVYIKQCLNDIDYEIDEINKKKRSIEKLIY